MVQVLRPPFSGLYVVQRPAYNTLWPQLRVRLLQKRKEIWRPGDLIRRPSLAVLDLHYQLLYDGLATANFGKDSIQADRCAECVLCGITLLIDLHS